MNIGFLIDSVSRKAGGLFESVRCLAKEMERRGDNLTVFSLSDELTATDAQAWEPLKLRIFPSTLGSLRYSADLSQGLRNSNLDLLFVHGLWKYCSRASLLWARKSGHPYVVHPHGMLDPWAVRNSSWKKKLAGFFFENAHLRGASCFRALCESEALSIRNFGLKNPICVVPNGVNLPDLTERQTAPWRLKAEGGKVLFYLGRLHPKKNLLRLIAAWAAARADCLPAREWTLVIAGWDQGGHQKELERLKEELEIGDSVTFLGPQFGEAKMSCYYQCDAFVLPSLSEGLPMVVLEAWAYAKPAMITPECNLPEGVAAGAAIEISTESAGIARGLRQLFEMSAADIAAMGNRGRDLVARRFLWTDVGGEMRNVAGWLAGGGPAPASLFQS